MTQTDPAPVTPPAAPPPRPFRLVRSFSWASLAGVVLVTAALIGLSRDQARHQLIDHESRANAELARALANELWPRYRDEVLGAGGLGSESLRAHPMQARLGAELQQRLRGLQVTKLKLFHIDGTVVYSTSEADLGQQADANPDFRRARMGQVASGLKASVAGGDPAAGPRDLIYSYIPVTTAGAAPEAVMEIYSDVTALMDRHGHRQWRSAGLVLLLLGGLYALLLGLVRRADQTMARHEAERAAREAEIRHRAQHDALTGLANRSHFLERLAETLALSQRTGRHGALMFIDLDRFKIVNDSLGHGAGDELLKTVAQRIRACMRRSDMLFRMGGDEFTVILPEIVRPEDAADLAQRIIDAVSLPVQLGEHRAEVGATIGIASIPGDGATAEELVRNADAAMYTAKQGGRGTHAFYRRSMNERVLRRVRLEAAMHEAHRERRFVLRYQPRVDARSRAVIGVETLLRWNDPVQGLVAPAQFIDVLEDMDLIQEVGEWVLRTACEQHLRWLAMGLPPLRVSVNVSARQFQSPRFVDTVARVIRESSVNAAAIELELTESMLITRPEQAAAAIEGLKAVGVRVALDDFGTGYSSLGYLHRFAVDTLKIDRSFVREVGTNPRDRAVTQAIVQMARALGIETVAEGVETEDQARFLVDVGCEELQGYLFAMPLAQEQVAALLLRAPAPAAGGQSATNTTAVRAGSTNVPLALS